MGTRVFIGGLRDPRIRERDVEDFFRGYGRIREVVIKSGYGFVEFDDVRDAEDAVYERNGRSLNGDRVVVEHAKRPSIRRRTPPRRAPCRSDYRVIIENISSRVSWQDLKDFMRETGEVTFCDAHRPLEGEGVCDYTTRDGMERAVDELSGRELRGRRIKIFRDRRRSRSRSPRRRRSRSRTPSRRRSRSSDGSRRRSRSPHRSPSSRPSVSGSESRSRSRVESRASDRRSTSDRI